MRVLYLNPFSQEISGPDESLLTLLGALIPGGVEAHVVLPAPGPPVERYRRLGATVHFAPLAPLRRDLSLAAATYPLRLAQAAKAVARTAREIRADLIHTNMEVLLEGGVVSRLLGIPHVLHYRGNTLDRPKLVFDALTAIWTATADRVFCISHATAGVFQRRGRTANVEVVYNPVDVKRFATAQRTDGLRAALGAKSGAALIGTIGRIHPRKDLETFLRTAALVAAQSAAVHFVIVGAAEAPIEREYEARLHALVTALGLDGRVTFAGTRRDIPEVIAALDVFVLTSRHEGFGRVVAEAMAAARPVVVTDEGAPPELIERGRFGLCARPNDPRDFAERIGDLLQHPETARALGAAARTQAECFDLAAIAARVRIHYEQIIARRDRTKQSAAPNVPAR